MTEPEPSDAAGVPEPDGPAPQPFPFALIALTALAGWGALSSEAGWIQVSCLVAVVLFAAAAIYQSRPAPRLPEEPPADDAP